LSSESHGENITPFIVAQPGPAVALPAAADTLRHVRRAAVLLATGVLATAFGAGGAPAPRGSVPACTTAGVQVIEHHLPLTTVTAACRGLSRAELNLALGRAIFEVAGAHQHKAAWRRRAAVAGARLAQLIESQRRHAATAPPRAGRPAPARAVPASRWGLGLGTLAAWLLTMGGGAFMLAGWIRRGGLHPRGGRNRLGPVVTLGHFSVASAGLLAWIAYLATGWTFLGWLAVAVLVAAIGLGMATLTVWTSRAIPAPPRPVSGPPGEAAAPPRRPQEDLRVIIPVVHGLTASATILLALLTVVTAR
jgi:manganese efflux pump family protein